MTWSFREATIEEICNVEYGTRVVRKKDAGTIYPVYGGGGETFFLDSYNRENRVVIARFAMSERCTRRVLGKFALNDSGLTLSPKDDSVLRQDYLDYFVLSINNQIYESARGTAQKNLDVPSFRQMKVVYPSSVEKQKEIVEKLDRAFAEIDQLETNLGVKVGKTHDLLQSIQNEALTATSEDWESCKIGDLGKWSTGSTPSTAKKEFWGDDVPFVTPADLNASGELGEIGRRISKLGSEQVRVVIAPSVLLVCIGATLGKVAWTSETITTNQQINTLQVDAKKTNHKFMMYLLSSPNMQKKLWDSSTGTTVPILNKGNLENIDIFIPSLEKQIEIVKRLDRAFAEIELLAARIQIEKEKAASIRQSLLSNAFTKKEEVA